MSSVKNFFSEKEKKTIVETIRKAELFSTGEIRLHLEDTCEKPLMVRTQEVFEKLNIHKTQFKNGILIYIAVKNKQFSIIGDEGIDQKVGATFWEEQSQIIQSYFKEEKFLDGIITVINNLSLVLNKYFPNLEAYNKNELPDEISFDD